MYSIPLSDKLVDQTRQLFNDEAAMTSWLQRQVEALLMEFNSRQAIKANARKAIEAMRLQSEQNGNAELSLDDINKEIRLTRKARKATRRSRTTMTAYSMR